MLGEKLPQQSLMRAGCTVVQWRSCIASEETT
jgi:hypothetical protein